MLEHFPLSTPRGLLLRPIDERDAGELFRLTDNNRVNLRLWLPWLDGVNKQEDTRQFIKLSKKHLDTRTGCVLSIRKKKVLIGVVDFHGWDKFNHHASMGYWLGESWRGQGFMGDAARTLVAFGFERMDLKRIEIRTAVGNQRSRRIPETLGFQCEGRLRSVEWLYDHFVDHDVFSLLREEWENAST